jgi:hypothetical protein
MMIVVDVVVAAELVIQESVLKCVNERFHIQEMRIKVKEERKEKRDEEDL